VNLDITDIQSLLFADVKNPFGAEHFQCLQIYISKTRICADISFGNGNTNGQHHIEAYTVQELNEKLTAFFTEMNAQN